MDGRPSLHAPVGCCCLHKDKGGRGGEKRNSFSPKPLRLLPFPSFLVDRKTREKSRPCCGFSPSSAANRICVSGSGSGRSVRWAAAARRRSWRRRRQRSTTARSASGASMPRRGTSPLPRTQLCSRFLFFSFFHCIIFCISAGLSRVFLSRTIRLLVFWGSREFQTEIQPFAQYQAFSSVMTVDFPMTMWSRFHAFGGIFVTCFFLPMFSVLFRLFLFPPCSFCLFTGLCYLLQYCMCAFISFYLTVIFVFALEQAK